MSLCNRLASILKGTASIQNGVCVVTKSRKIDASILGQKTKSPLVLPTLFSFERTRGQGKKTLNLGETVALQHEVATLVEALLKEGIIVTAIHNHWLFDDPRLMYVHWEQVSRPGAFARKSARALEKIGA